MPAHGVDEHNCMIQGDVLFQARGVL